MTGAGTLLALLLLQYCFSLLMIRVASGQWALISQPLTWLYSFWIIGLALLALPIYEYQEVVSAWGGGVLLGTLFSFTLGALVVEFRREKLKDRPRDQDQLVGPYKYTPHLLLGGCVGGVLMIINAYLTGGISMAERLDADNAAMIREVFMNASVSKIGPLYGPASTFYNVGFGGVLLYFSYLGSVGFVAAKKNSFALMLTIAFMAVSGVFSVLFAGGRITVVMLVLMASLSYYGGVLLKRRRNRVIPDFQPARSRKKYIFAVLAAVFVLGALWHSSTTFLEKRTAYAAPEALLYTTHRAKFSVESQRLVSQSKDVGYAIFTMSYVSTPIPTYLYYLDLPESRSVEPLLGQYSFPVLARYFLRITGQYDPNYWNLSRTKVFAPLAAMNLGTNVWATLNRDLLVDFGVWGSVLFMFLLGWLSQYIYKRERMAYTPEWIPISVLVKLLLLFSGLTSLLYMNQFAWPLYTCAGILFFVLRVAANKSIKKEPSL